MSVALALALAAQMQGRMSGQMPGMDHAGHDMPGMTMPMPPARPATKRARKAHAKPRRATAAKPVVCPAEHAAMGHCAAPSIAKSAPANATSCAPEHAAMGHCPAPSIATPAPASATSCPPGHEAMGHCATGPSGTALPAGNAPAPAAPAANYADRIWGAAAMAPARALLRREHGGMSFHQVMLNIAEIQPQRGRDGYRWDGEAWFGGDVDRLVLKSEGDGAFGTRATGEVQALYSRAIGPYFNVQGGIRQDIGNDRRYAVAGVEGLAPYWFDVEATAFLSDRGDLLARVEGYYDQRITQRLILQPRAELNLSAQDVPRDRVGAGLVDAELGVRLRYEIRREFAPYAGVSWERAFGDTRRLRGGSSGGAAFVLGVRAWF